MDTCNQLKVKLWTSSHGMHKHYLPQSFKQIYKPNPLIALPEIDAKPGRLINEIFFDELKSDFDNLDENSPPQINVLLMGDNNLRTQAFRGGFRLYKTTKQIVDLHKETRHPLLVLGVLPSPGTYNQTLPLSEFSDNIIQQYIIDNHQKGQARNVVFVAATPFFSDTEGFLLYKTLYSRDGVHLSRMGALQLALKILHHCGNLASMILAQQNIHPKLDI